MKLFDILIQLIGDGLLLALASMIVRHRLQRKYPFFFAYVLIAFVVSAVRLSVSGDDSAYLYAYWITDPLLYILALLALNEAFYDFFYRFYSFWWFRLILPSVVAGMLFISIRQGLLRPVAGVPLLMSVMLSVDSAVSLIEASIFILFMLLSLSLRVRLHRYSYCIALGFALSGMGDWTSSVLIHGSGYGLAARYAAPAGYLSACLIWLCCFSTKSRAEPKLEFGRTAPASR